jgi:hypothetical protein
MFLIGIHALKTSNVELATQNKRLECDMVCTEGRVLPIHHILSVETVSCVDSVVGIWKGGMNLCLAAVLSHWPNYLFIDTRSIMHIVTI